MNKSLNFSATDFFLTLVNKKKKKKKKWQSQRDEGSQFPLSGQKNPKKKPATAWPPRDLTPTQFFFFIKLARVVFKILILKDAKRLTQHCNNIKKK